MLDGLWEIVYIDGKVVIPTIADTNVTWLTTEPVAVLDWSDRTALLAAIVENICAGNPRRKFPEKLPGYPSIVALRAGFRSEREFEARAKLWAIERQQFKFRIVPYRRCKSGRGWEEDRANCVELPERASERDVATRLVEMIEAASK